MSQEMIAFKKNDLMHPQRAFVEARITPAFASEICRMRFGGDELVELLAQMAISTEQGLQDDPPAIEVQFRGKLKMANLLEGPVVKDTRTFWLEGETIIASEKRYLHEEKREVDFFLTFYPVGGVLYIAYDPIEDVPGYMFVQGIGVE